MIMCHHPLCKPVPILGQHKLSVFNCYTYSSHIVATLIHGDSTGTLLFGRRLMAIGCFIEQCLTVTHLWQTRVSISGLDRNKKIIIIKKNENKYKNLHRGLFGAY